jgi:hypothetical protein
MFLREKLKEIFIKEKGGRITMNTMNEVLLRRKNSFIVTEKEFAYDSFVAAKNKEDLLDFLNEDSKLKDLNHEKFNSLEEFYIAFVPDYLGKKDVINDCNEYFKRLGYTLGSSFDDLAFYKLDHIRDTLMEVYDILKSLKGADINYSTLNDISTDTESEDNVELIKLEKATSDDYAKIIKNLLSSKTSLSNKDLEDIKNSVSVNSNIILSIKEIPFKENLIAVTKLLMQNGLSLYTTKWFNNTTDVLRLIVGLSDGDISLVTQCRFKNLKNREKKFIVSLLNTVVKNNSNAYEDMYKKKNLWITAAYKLNVGTFKQYDYALKAISMLRNGEHIDTFMGKVDNLIKNNQIIPAVDLLKTRPGEFARRLNEFINKPDLTEKDLHYIMNVYKNIVSKLSSPVLISIITFFKNYNKEGLRVFNVKANSSKSYAVLNTCNDLKSKFIDYIVQVSNNALVNLYMEKDYMGYVYLSDEFKNFAIPNTLRTSNSTSRIVTRGSRESFDYDKLRAFIHWTNTEDGTRIDVDLSCGLFTENLTCVEYVDFTHLKCEGMKHSGDITDGGDFNGEGAAEFIDIYVETLRKHNVKYIVPQIYVFSKIPFSQLNCTFGYTNELTGKINPKNVFNKMAITTNEMNIVPFIMDIETKEIIYVDAPIAHCDMKQKTTPKTQMVETHLNSLQVILYNFIHTNRMSMYDLVKYNIQARGIETDDISNADVIFTNKQIDITELNKKREENNQPLIKVITPYDIDEFVGDLL